MEGGDCRGWRKNGSLRRRDGRGWKGDCKGGGIIGAGVGGW